MNFKKYKQFVNRFATEARANSGGTTEGAYRYLLQKKDPMMISFNYVEKQYALVDLRKHFMKYQGEDLSKIMSNLDLVYIYRSLDPRTRYDVE